MIRTLLAIFAFALTVTARDKTLDIYWIDSEGGGSTLIVTPAGKLGRGDDGLGLNSYPPLA